MKKVITIIVLGISTLKLIAQSGSFFDPRDGQEYPTITIQYQLEGGAMVEREWMTKNLNFNTPGSFCYKDYEAYCEVYGRLYTWSEAVDICPEPWYLPSGLEWEALYQKFGSQRNAGLELLQGGKSGLNIICGGFGELDGTYIDVGVNAYYWKYEDLVTRESGLITIHSHEGQISNERIGEQHKNSVRCIRNYAGRSSQ